jgi:hypothetical protein
MFVTYLHNVPDLERLVQCFAPMSLAMAVGNTAVMDRVESLRIDHSHE